MLHFSGRILILCGVVAGLLAPQVAVSQATQAIIPEGEEVSIRFEQSLSSSFNKTGDQFEISLDDPIELSNGIVIQAGYRGQGHVVRARKGGLAGRKGELEIALDSVQVGSATVKLRGSQSKSGTAGWGSAAGAIMLFGVFGLMATRGSDVNIARGQIITAYVDAPVAVTVPISAPPPDRP